MNFNVLAILLKLKIKVMIEKMFFCFHNMYFLALNYQFYIGYNYIYNKLNIFLLFYYKTN